MKRAAALALSIMIAAPAWAAEISSAFDRAAQAELARTDELTQEDYPPPYYVSLTGIDIDSWERRCVFGAETFSSRFEQRLLVPDVRVGSLELDNHPSGAVNGFVGQFVARDGDEFSLRHSIWQAMDASFKSASAEFLRKQAQRETLGKADYDTDDLSKETPRSAVRERPRDAWDRDSLAAACRDASAVFRGAPWLLSGEASVRARRQWSSLRDTEGSRVDFPRDSVELELQASAMAPDGLRLDVQRRFTAASPAELPAAAELEKDASDMVSALERLKAVSSTSPFSAPALIDPSISAAVVLSIGLRLSGEEARNPSGAQTFKGKLGKPVMRPEFSLTDDPTLPAFQGRPLVGRYEFDDQGVPPRRARLIERGVLKGLLTSRYPASGFLKSNGHGRAFAGYAPQGMPGSLFLDTSAPQSEQELLSELRAECRRRGKRYGIWVKRLRTFTQQQGSSDQTAIRLMPELVYLVDADTGKLTLTRNLDLVGTPLVLLSNILSAGRDAQAQNLIFNVPVSAVTPSLLLSEAELQRSEVKPERPPILPPPRP